MVLTAAGSGSVSVPCKILWFSLRLLDIFSCSGIRYGLKVRFWRFWCWSLVALVWMGESMGAGLFGLGVVVRISLADSGTAVARRSSILWDSSSGCRYWRSRLVFMSVVVLLLGSCCCFMVTRLWWSWIHQRVWGLCISISPGLDCSSRFVSVFRSAVQDSADYDVGSYFFHRIWRGDFRLAFGGAECSALCDGVGWSWGSVGFFVSSVWISQLDSKALSSVLDSLLFLPELPLRLLVNYPLWSFGLVTLCHSLVLNRRVLPDFLVRDFGASAQSRLVME